MTKEQLQYFNSMLPGQSLKVCKAMSPEDLVKAGKEYIDQHGELEFNHDYSVLTKLHPIPKDNIVGFYFDN